MPDTTPNLGLLKGVDADNWRTYLKTDLAASLDGLDKAVGQVFNVRGYGADPTGAADSGPAFNSALAAANAAGGGRVHAPAGTYKITTQVVVPGNNVVLEGAGLGRTVLTDTADFGTGVVYASGRSGLTVRNLTVRPSSNGYGVYIEGDVSDVLVENVLVDQQRTDGSGLIFAAGATGANRVTFRGVRVLSPANATGTSGIQIGGGTLVGSRSYDLLVEGCTTDGFVTGFQNGQNGVWRNARLASCRFTNARKWGAYLYHYDQCQVVNCEFSGNDVGAFMDDDSPGQGGLVANCLFRDNLTIGLYREEWAKGALVGCSFQGNGYGLVLMSGRDCAITGCVVYGNTRDGVLVDKNASITSLAGSGPAAGANYAVTNITYVQDVTLTGCVISGNSRHGINIKGVQRGFVLSGCVVAQNGQADNPTPTNYADVNLDADTGAANNYAVTLAGVTLGNLGGTGTDTGYTKWGVRSAASTLSELAITGCRIEGVSAPIVVPSGTLTVKSSTFSNCGATLTLPTTTEWTANTVVGGTLLPPTEVVGPNVVAANDLVLVPRKVGVPNVYRITGNTQINHIASTGWPSGSIVVLLFSGTPTVKHGNASSGVNKWLILAAGLDFAATANDTLTLLYDGDTTVGWYELARTVI